MKKFILIPVFVAMAVVVAGGCISKKSPTPNVEGSQKTTASVSGESSSSTSSAINRDSLSASSSTEVGVDTSGWNIYKNKALGIKIELPSTWKMATNGDKERLSFSSGRSSAGSITLSMHVTTSTVDEVKKERASGYMGSTYDEMEPVTLGGMNGYRLNALYGPSAVTDYTHLSTGQYLLSREGGYLEIVFTANSEELSDDLAQDMEDWKKIAETISRY